MKNFLQTNITPILLSALIALFSYMTHAVITNQADIRALKSDMTEIKSTLNDMLKIMIERGKDEK